MIAISDPTPPAPPPAAFNMAAHVLAHAPRLGDKIALAVLSPGGAQRWSYARLESAVRGLATGLQARGLQPGDRVLMRLGNDIDFPITYLAAIAAGLIPIPTSAQLTTREITRIAQETTPRLIVAGAGIALPEGDIPTLPAADLPALYDLAPADYVLGAPDRPAYIVYTSGTSGKPHAVTHAHRAIWARQMMFDGWYGLRESDRLLHAGAFNWTYTLGTGLMDPWAMGATALIPAAGVDSAMLPLLLRRHDATIFAAAPGVYRQMLRGNIAPLPRLRHGLSAGEKLPESTRARWQDATGTPIFEAFGMSECSTFISAAPDRPAPSGSIGYPQAGRRVAVLGPDGPALRGSDGVLAISRDDPGLMLGYWNDPTATEARFRGEWFVTGDQARMDADGAITYLGRADDMMNAGGFRVSPAEVEDVFNAHPGIRDCAAVEQQVKADATAIWLFYTADAPIDLDELHAYGATHLARYKAPRHFVHIDSIPRNANGKLLRRALREQA